MTILIAFVTFLLATFTAWGASVSSNLTVTITGGATTSDLSVAPNGHYLNKGSTPFFFLSDTEWVLNLRSDADITSILNDRAAKGFSVVQVFATRGWVGFDGAGDVTHDANGNLPFISNDVTQLNVPYWNRWLSIADQAASKGLHLLLVYAEPVTGGAPWVCNTTAQCYEYGRQVGNLFRTRTNVIFSNGYDSHASSASDYYRAIAEGTADGVNGVNSFDGSANYNTTMMTFHGYDITTTFHTDTWLDFYGTEVWGCIACLYDEVNTTYNLTGPIKPSMILEANYETYSYPDGTTTPYLNRVEAYHVFFAGGGGYAYGHNDNYHPERPVSGYLSSGGAQGMQQLSTFMRSYTWSRMAPNQSIVSSGAGSGITRLAAMNSLDGDKCVVYYPQVVAATIAMNCVTSSNTVNASWLDPRNGNTQTIGSFNNSTSQTLTPPGGWEDAVLVLDAGTATPPTFAAVSMSGLTFTSGTASTVGTATATLSSGTPSPTWSLKTSGTDSASGAACNDYSVYFAVNSSSGAVTVNTSTPAQSYPGTCLQATQSGVSNSPYSKAFTLVGSSVTPQISSVGSTNVFFSAQAGNANATIGTLSAVVTTGSFSGTFVLATSGACTGANNSSFVIAGTTLKVGASDVTTAQNYSICVRATDAAFSNSPFFQAISLTGTGAGTVVATATYTNYSGATLPAGTPISFGQAFRYGDIMSNTHPLIRDASTHTPLAGQQWDEIATWCSHTPGGSCVTGGTGFNGSWRHGVWAAWLPNSLANGASIQIEFVSTAGSYTESSHQALSALCSGPAAHDLKIHLSDVRGQDDLVRDSGDATFRVCDNITNVGRDAPRHIRAGNVYDEYAVSGMFVYATSGRKDPLLYGTCNIDIFTKSSDGASPGDVRWMCWINNSWMNVAAGSTGNSGNIGPAGFANDPQSISYRPEVLDGSTSVLNWNGLDATISSSNNPIHASSSVGCYTGTDNYCMSVPSASGINSWYGGMAVRASCSATCPGGMNNNQLYYVAPDGAAGTNDINSTNYGLALAPNLTYFPYRFMTSSQGSGTTNMSFRVQQYHWTSIPLFDQTGQNNWSPFGTTTRVTRKVYPNFTAGEKLYWEQTGAVIPLNLSLSMDTLFPTANQYQSSYYNPNGTGVVIGGNGTGPRPDLGVINAYAVQAFVFGGEAAWDYARLFTLGDTTYANGIEGATILNEGTGRIPPLNNGPPVGAGGNGSGGSYASLGAPHNQANYSGFGAQDMAIMPINLPNVNYPADHGQWNSSVYISHMPSFNSLTYIIFGDRHWLDAMRFRGNADFAQQRTGPGPELGEGYLRDNNAKFSDGNIYHYYGLLIDCCQGRGVAWMMRDVIYAASYGGDNDIERSYYNDMLIETRNYWPMWLRWKDGPNQNAPNNTNYSTSIVEPSGDGDGIVAEAFIMTYIADAAYNMVVWLHEPLGSTWAKQFQRFTEGVFGGRLAGALPYYAFDYYYTYASNTGNLSSVTNQQGSVGLTTNGIDASDFGIAPTIFALSGGQWKVLTYIVQNGDKVMNMWGANILASPGPIDQLGPGYRNVINASQVNDSSGQYSLFQIQCNSADHTAFPSQCPTAGGPFTDLTRGGSSIAGSASEVMKLRLSYDNPANTGYGFSSVNYMQYGGQKINLLHILGYNVVNSMAAWVTRGGAYSTNIPENNWDPTVIIPGLPTAVNSIP